MCFSPQRRTIFQHQNVQKWSKHVMFCAFSLPHVPFATGAYNFSTSELTKVVQTRHVLCIFTSECAFRHRGVQFFNIRTYKSGPNTSCFVHFHFRMCLSPQGRALFQHQNLQKWSKHVMFCTFSLQNLLFATAACNFSTSELQKVLRHRQFLSIFTSKCAFRHSGLQFLMSPLSTYTSAPAALTGLLFDWPDTRIIEKTQHFVTSLTFSADVSSFTWLWHYCIFCRLTWRLYCWAMHLVFNSPYCRKFLFKLPSIIYEYIHIWLLKHAMILFGWNRSNHRSMMWFGYFGWNCNLTVENAKKHLWTGSPKLTSGLSNITKYCACQKHWQHTLSPPVHNSLLHSPEGTTLLCATLLPASLLYSTLVLTLKSLHIGIFSW